jgi:hypothetical protein
MFAAGPKFMKGSFGNPYWMIITLGASAYEAPETPVGSSVASIGFPGGNKCKNLALVHREIQTPKMSCSHPDRPSSAYIPALGSSCSLGESLGRATRQARTQPVSNTLVGVRCTMQDE